MAEGDGPVTHRTGRRELPPAAGAAAGPAALPPGVLPCALALQGFEWLLVASFFLALCLMGGCCWWPMTESDGEGTQTELA